jgi:hypothetical protein
MTFRELQFCGNIHDSSPEKVGVVGSLFTSTTRAGQGK